MSWDIPLTDGYEYEVVPNVSKRPGSDHFRGIRNPQLFDQVSVWKPDGVHITGYAYASHLFAMYAFHRRKIPVLFRGDSHLLDQSRRLKWQIKRAILSQTYKWTDVCLYVGKNNYDYFRALGVPESKLFYCPHSIEVKRFSEPNEQLEAKARAWRKELGVPDKAKVLLFAGKFEKKKRPIELMQAFQQIADPKLILIMVGNGELEGDVRRIAAKTPEKFRIIPFQNQSAMPVVYRLGDVFVLPSAFGETWGLAVNEALACGRRVLISDKVGCAREISAVENGGCEVFRADDWDDFERKMTRLFASSIETQHLREYARNFDITATERCLVTALEASA